MLPLFSDNPYCLAILFKRLRLESSLISCAADVFFACTFVTFVCTVCNWLCALLVAMFVETNIMANPNTTKLKPTHNTFSNNEKATRCVLMDGFGVTTVFVLCTGVVAPGVCCGNSRANPFWAILITPLIIPEYYLFVIFKRSMARNLALRARRLASISASLGTTGLRLTKR